MTPIIKPFYFNPFRECTYIVSDENKQAIVIDAGCSTPSEQTRLKTYIEQQQLHIKAHLLTHAHLDHLLGARFVHDNYNVLPHLHPADAFLFERQEQQAGSFGCPLYDNPLEQFIPLKDADMLTFGNISLRVIHTPGHSPGSVCFYCDDPNTPILFSGDTLFAGGVGRTDLFGGSTGDLRHSLQSKLFVLPCNTTVYPGHGFSTTIAAEQHTSVLW